MTIELLSNGNGIVSCPVILLHCFCSHTKTYCSWKLIGQFYQYSSFIGQEYSALTWHASSTFEFWSNNRIYWSNFLRIYSVQNKQQTISSFLTWYDFYKDLGICSLSSVNRSNLFQLFICQWQKPWLTIKDK